MKSSTRTTAPAGDTELGRALLTLGLRPQLPVTVEHLHRLVCARHPRLNRSWTWELAAAYRQVFAAVAAISGVGGDPAGRGDRSPAPGRRGRGR